MRHRLAIAGFAFPIVLTQLSACTEGGEPITAAPRVILPKTALDQTGKLDLVSTPAGLRRRECVHGIDEGDNVNEATGEVHRKGGGTYKIRLCGPLGTGLPGGHKGGGPLDSPDGWVEYAFVYTAFTRNVTALWTVPSAPANTYPQGRNYFAFPGTDNGHYILQPVLQYGNNGVFGGNYWAISAWQCGSTIQDCYHSTNARTVSPGHSILGYVTASGCTIAVACHWLIVAKDVTTGDSAYYSFDGTDDYLYAYGGVVEQHNMVGCGDYPSTGITFSSISITDANGSVSLSNWNPIAHTGSSYTPLCLFAVSPSGSTVTLNHNPTITLGGYAAGEVPTLTWSAVPGATSYEVYRTWYNNEAQTGSNSTEYLGTGSSGWTDPNLCTDAYYGGNMPPFGSLGYINYQIIARGPGTDNYGSSQSVHFRLANCAP